MQSASRFYFCLTIAFVKEEKQAKPEKQETQTLVQHLKKSAGILKNSKVLVAMILSTASTGIFIASLEIYYQPHFIAMLPDESMSWLLGVLTCLYFGAVTVGTIAVERLLDRSRHPIAVFLLCRVLIGAALLAMAMQTGIAPFIIFYTGIYFFIGMADVPESVLINSEIPNENRASLLSLNSLVLQLGALAFSACGVFIVGKVGIAEMWKIMAALLFIMIGVVGIKLYFAKRSQTETRCIDKEKKIATESAASEK